MYFAYLTVVWESPLYTIFLPINLIQNGLILFFLIQDRLLLSRWTSWYAVWDQSVKLIWQVIMSEKRERERAGLIQSASRGSSSCLVMLLFRHIRWIVTSVKLGWTLGWLSRRIKRRWPSPSPCSSGYGSPTPISTTENIRIYTLSQRPINSFACIKMAEFSIRQGKQTYFIYHCCV